MPARVYQAVICNVKGYLTVLTVIFVDDGSTDASLMIIKRICRSAPYCGYVRLSRNFGKEAAMSAGLDYSRSDALVIIDADLQDPPELIPEMVTLLEQQQTDVVYGKRRTRHGESWFRKSCANLFYRLFDKFSRFPFPRDTLLQETVYGWERLRGRIFFQPLASV